MEAETEVKSNRSSRDRQRREIKGNILKEQYRSGQGGLGDIQTEKCLFKSITLNTIKAIVMSALVELLKKKFLSKFAKHQQYSGVQM